MDKYCVYVHVNKVNDKVYVGMTNDISRRWRVGGIEYKPPRTENQNGRSFWNAIKKHGWGSFKSRVLVDGLSYEQAIEKEKEYIKKYRSHEKERGYNISTGGNGGRVYDEHPRGMLGKAHNEKFRKRQSLLMRRLNKEGKTGAVWKNGHPRGMLGKTHSEEYKERLRNTPAHKHGSARKVIVTYPDGNTKVFDCVKYCRDHYNIGSSLMTRLLKSSKPYKLSKGVNKSVKRNLEKIVGLKFEYLDNTEVTTEIKKTVEP